MLAVLAQHVAPSLSAAEAVVRLLVAPDAPRTTRPPSVLIPAAPMAHESPVQVSVPPSLLLLLDAGE
jgi:hypothetical protein